MIIKKSLVSTCLQCIYIMRDTLALFFYLNYTTLVYVWIFWCKIHLKYHEIGGFLLLVIVMLIFN